MSSRRGLSGSDPAIGQKLNNVIVVGTFASRAKQPQTEIELDELEELARTLNTTVLERSIVRLREPNPATLIGKGAVEELGARIVEMGKPSVLFNDELTPRQQRNLEEAWETEVLDRSEVILAIFARRATSAEGRLQVEMAQLEHLLPRLAGGWSHLERQRGGVGIRGGAGEKQIEVDRRLINQKLKRLRERLAQVQRSRETRRRARTGVPLASVALVGYTNAGKSTLLNALTHSEVFADNLLFATLDPTSRRVELTSGRLIILTDTVGFIQALPTELVQAFASTLEEVREAHILAIVVDVAHPDAEQHLTTVLETLEGMECDQPVVLVASKCDRLDTAELDDVVAGLEDVADAPAVRISAQTGAGLRDFRDAVDALAARVVPETRANRPIIASDIAVDDDAGSTSA